VLRELLDHAIEIGIADAEAPSEPVPTAFGDSFAVSDHLELTGLTWRSHGFNSEALLDEGHETRGLGLVVLSCRAVGDLDLHSVCPPICLTRPSRARVRAVVKHEEVANPVEVGLFRTAAVVSGAQGSYCAVVEPRCRLTKE